MCSQNGRKTMGGDNQVIILRCYFWAKHYDSGKKERMSSGMFARTFTLVPNSMRQTKNKRGKKTCFAIVVPYARKCFNDTEIDTLAIHHICW